MNTKQGRESIIERRKVKTYMGTLMADKVFKERFNQEYRNLSISEQIVRTRRATHLTQMALAKKVAFIPSR